MIRRFSEDIGVTYDIRAFAPDLVSGIGQEALPGQVRLNSTIEPPARLQPALPSRASIFAHAEASAVPLMPLSTDRPPRC